MKISLHTLFLAMALALALFLTNCSSDSPPAPIQEEEEEEEIIISYNEFTPVETHGQLKVSGNKIIDQHDNPVQFRGMSLFWSQWMGKYYTPAVVDFLQENWRCTIVRAALGVFKDQAGSYLTNPEVEKQKIITVVDAAIEEGIYVIIDWHDHDAHKHLTQAKAFFGEMAQLYGSYPNVIYEPFNEPLTTAHWSTVIKPYHEAIIDTIRAHDPDNIIICGTRSWSQEVEEASLDPIDDENVAYALHYYAATHKTSLRNKAIAALENDVALWVTEFGVTQSSGNGIIDSVETHIWWDFLDDHKISWCNWSIADKNEASAALKSNASTSGGWPESKITLSGILVRTELRRKNPSE